MFSVRFANMLGPELKDDEFESDMPMESIPEPLAPATSALEGIVAVPLWQKAFLAGTVLALLVFVLRQRRRSKTVMNEKVIA
jgi:hypothetical protein